MAKRVNCNASNEVILPKKIQKLSESANIFDILEKFGDVLKFLPISDLVSLAETNGNIAASILKWISREESTAYIFRHWKPDEKGHFVFGKSEIRMSIDDSEECLRFLDDFRQLLIKLTRILPIKKHMQLASMILSRLKFSSKDLGCKIQGMKCTASQHKPTKSVDVRHCCVKNYAIFLDLGSKIGSTFMNRWMRENLKEAFDFVFTWAEKKFDIASQIRDKFFNSKYVIGRDGELEIRLRQTLLSFFWNNLDIELRPKWLVEMLLAVTGGNARHQALILFLMFGPVQKVKYGQTQLQWVMWDEPSDILHYNEDFKPLGEVLSILFKIKFLSMETLTQMMSYSKDSSYSWSDQVLIFKIDFQMCFNELFLHREWLCYFFSCPKKLNDGICCKNSTVAMHFLRQKCQEF